MKEYQDSLQHRLESISYYKFIRQKWNGWSYKREADPFASSANDILNFLAFLYGKEYVSCWVNCQCPAISEYHVHVNINPFNSTQEFLLWWQVYLIINLLNHDMLLLGIKNKYWITWMINQPNWIYYLSQFLKKDAQLPALKETLGISEIYYSNNWICVQAWSQIHFYRW